MLGSVVDVLLPLSNRLDYTPLHAHGRAALATRLAQKTNRSATKCDRSVSRIFQHAFRDDALGDAAWSDDALTQAGLGKWIRPATLQYSPRISLSVADQAPSEDKTIRLLLRSAADGALIESVIIPASHGRDTPRTTLCISSQVGCARACTFCETGTLGLERQLDAAEIVDQYRLAARLITAQNSDEGCSEPDAIAPISNIVFMGMGEPMDNLDAVCLAIELLSDHHAFAFPPSRITVSTVGVVHKLEELFRRTRAELAVSLNASNDQQRDAIMPINRRYDLQRLRGEVMRVLPPGRRVLFQYALFAGFNDAPSDADALADFVSGIKCRVNVIPANPGPDPALVAPAPERVDAFVERLHQRGVMTLVRRPRGRDVGGACGQLAGKHRLASTTDTP